LEAELPNYVDPEYLPGPNFKITEPRRMKHKVILSFFNHIVEQQHTYDLPQVFCFKYADEARKRTLGMNSHIEGDNDGAGAKPVTARRARPLKGKTKKKLVKKTLPLTINGAGTGTADTSPSDSVGVEPDLTVTQRPQGKRSKKKAKTALNTRATGTANGGRVDAQPSNDQEGIQEAPSPQHGQARPGRKKLKMGLNPVGTHPDMCHADPMNDGQADLGSVNDQHGITGTSACPPPWPKPIAKQSTASLNLAHNLGDRGRQVINEDQIDPSLRGPSHMISASHPAINTSDNLALQEANQYIVTASGIIHFAMLGYVVSRAMVAR
jgi:hypothetical protein